MRSLSANRTGSRRPEAPRAREERPRPVAVQNPDGDRHAHQGDAIEPACIPPPKSDRQRPLAGLGVGLDVTQVVGLEERGGQQPDRDAGPQREPPVVAVLNGCPPSEITNGACCT